MDIGNAGRFLQAAFVLIVLKGKAKFLLRVLLVFLQLVYLLEASLFDPKVGVWNLGYFFYFLNNQMKNAEKRDKIVSDTYHPYILL